MNIKKSILHAIAAIMETPEYKFTAILFSLWLLSTIMVSLPTLPRPSHEYYEVSYNDLKSFLATDQTDNREYIKGEWNCVSFTDQLLENASKYGLKGYFTIIQYHNVDDSSTHAIAMFNTDQGFIYIEPQNDKEVDPDTFKIYAIYESSHGNFIGS